jgi:hypothetical protein
MTKIAGSGSESGSISQRHGSADPDPHQNVMDPEQCFQEYYLKWRVLEFFLGLLLHFGYQAVFLISKFLGLVVGLNERVIEVASEVPYSRLCIYLVAFRFLK